jgi:tRNA(Ile)-lysidine synthase
MAGPGGHAPPVATRLESAVRAAVARHRLLDPGDRILAAVSGGSDSVALLHALWRLRGDLALDLRACHVHHGLRPSAERDAVFVEQLASTLGCPLEIERVVVPLGAGRSPEEAARAARYAALERVARAVGADRVALGHTADDQAETVLMRVLQGAGPRGLSGIPVRRGPFIRPLLDVGRGEVLAHLAAHDLSWVEDETNRDPKFLRNRIRHEMLPLLAAQGWPEIGRALRRIARASRETVEALDALLGPEAARLARPALGGFLIDLAPLRERPPGVAKALLRAALLRAAPAAVLRGGLRESHLTALHALLGGRVGARVRLPRGLLVERARDGLWVARWTPPADPLAISVPGETAFFGGGVRLQVDVVSSAPEPPADARWEAWFDADAVPGPLAIRHCRPGDRVEPFGGEGPVRVMSLLARAGVPRVGRPRWPLLVGGGVSGEEVLWVIGVRRGRQAPVGPETRAMLRVRAVVYPEVSVTREEVP